MLKKDQEKVSFKNKNKILNHYKRKNPKYQRNYHKIKRKWGIASY